MTNAFATLVRLAARHAYYGDGPVPLAWVPFPDTAARLRGVGAVVRTAGAEVVVGVPTVLSDPQDPDSTPVLARRPRGDAFRFALVPTDAGVAAVTEAPDWRPSRTVVALDNLRDDAEGDAAVLGHGADRFGAPVVLATSPTLRLPLDPPLASVDVAVRDRAGSVVVEYSETFAEPSDVAAVPLYDLPAGRYAVEVAGGPALDVFVAPSLRGLAPLAVAEVFVAAPSGLSLPASSQVLDGDAPTGRRLWADVPARTTRWRYVVVKTSGEAGAALGDFAVEPVGAEPQLAAGDPGEFTTVAPVAWRRGPAQTRLARATAPNATEPVHPLPNPGPGTPLVEDAGGPLAIHHVYV